MKLATLLALVSLLLVQAPHPPELPPGEFCEHRAPTGPAPKHICECQRECIDGNPDNVTRDVNCKQDCHEAHCHCPLRSCP